MRRLTNSLKRARARLKKRRHNLRYALKKRSAGQVAVAALLTLLLTGVAFAQNSPPPVSPAPDDLVVACERCVDELKVLRVEVSGLREQLRMKDELIAMQARSLAEKAEIIGFWKDAATARKEAISIDSRIEQIQSAQLVECKLEVSRLRNPGFFRSLFSRETITGAVVGYGVGRVQR